MSALRVAGTGPQGRHQRARLERAETRIVASKVPVHPHQRFERRDRGGQKGSYRDNPVDAIAAALLKRKADEYNAVGALTRFVEPAA